jgi:hypothetical protein
MSLCDIPDAHVVKCTQVTNRLLKEQDKQSIIEQYRGYMYTKICDAIKYFEQSGNNCATLSIDKNCEFSVPSKNFSFLFHEIHYGGKRVYKNEGFSWKERKCDPYFHKLFKELQKIMYEKGYYLLDVSDPELSFSLTIKLYLERPYWYDTEKHNILWHGFNKIP